MNATYVKLVLVLLYAMQIDTKSPRSAMQPSFWHSDLQLNNLHMLPTTTQIPSGSGLLLLHLYRLLLRAMTVSSADT